MGCGFGRPWSVRDPFPFENSYGVLALNALACLWVARRVVVISCAATTRAESRTKADQIRVKARRGIINHYVEHCADALLDVLEARGHIPR
jgi:hypothetical protein